MVESFIGTEKKKNLVLDVEPERLNERLSIQKGNFLFPCNIENSFMNNLLATFRITKSQSDYALTNSTNIDSICPDDLNNACVVKIILPTTCHGTALSDLREMNITSTTLFPGLDGFARSLRYRLQSSIDKDWEAKWDAFAQKKLE